MCNPTTAALATVAGTAVQMKGAKKAGEAAADVAMSNAKQAYIDFAQTKLEAKQFTNDREEKLRNDLEASNAIFAFGNRSSDASIKAYKENETSVAYTDIARGTLSSVISGGQAIGQAQQSISDASFEKRTAALRSAGYLAQGMYGLSQIA